MPGKKNLKAKMASLSALGAGALVAGAGTADASVVYSGPIDAHVGFGAGSLTHYVSAPMGPDSVNFLFVTSNNVSGAFHRYGIYAAGCACLGFGMTSSGSYLKLLDKSQPFVARSANTYVFMGGRIWASFGNTVSAPPPLATTFGLKPFSDKYVLFSFDTSSHPYYGWIHLSFTVQGGFGNDAAFGPDLVIHDYAWDDSGQPVVAGRVTPAVPEPGTLASSGLAALALGAVGLRNWRRARAKQVA